MKKVIMIASICMMLFPFEGMSYPSPKSPSCYNKTNCKNRKAKNKKKKGKKEDKNRNRRRRRRRNKDKKDCIYEIQYPVKNNFPKEEDPLFPEEPMPYDI